MEGSTVSFKASQKGLVLILNDKAAFDNILSELKKKLISAGKFFKGATLDITYRGRLVSEEEVKMLSELIEKESGAIVSSMKEDVTVQPVKAEPMPPKIKKLMYFEGTEEGMTRFYNGTVRSGQIIKYPGNVVVTGDINPGGEIQAAGNIFVLGTIRGTVHAGCDGNKNAVISAVNLLPTQLRIADTIAIPPEEPSSKKGANPETARIKEGRIIIEHNGA